MRFFVKILIKANVNISNDLNVSDVFRSVNYIGSYQSLLEPFGVHSPCTRSNVVYTSINLRKMEKNPEIL